MGQYRRLDYSTWGRCKTGVSEGTKMGRTRERESSREDKMKVTLRGRDEGTKERERERERESGITKRGREKIKGRWWRERNHKGMKGEGEREVK